MSDPKAWRAGRQVGRTLYVGDALIGMVDTPELAAQVVTAVNAHEGLVKALGNYLRFSEEVLSLWDSRDWSALEVALKRLAKEGKAALEKAGA